MKCTITTVPCAFALALLSTEALASTDHFLEFQIPATDAAQLVHKRLSAGANFCPVTIPCPNGGATCILDRFDVGSVGTLSRETVLTNIAVNSTRNISGRRVFYDQDVTVYVQTQACALDPSCDVETAYPLSVRFEMYASDGDICMRGLSYTPVVPGVVPPPVNVCFSLNEATAGGIMDNAGTEVSGAGVALDGSGTRLGLRIELDRADDYTPARIAAWSSFLGGALQGSETAGWSLFAHKSLVVETVREEMVKAVQAEPDVTLIGNHVAVLWTGRNGSGARVTTAFDVNATTSECGNPIAVSIASSTNIQINPAGDGIRAQGNVSFDADDGDVFECSGPLGPILLPLILTDVVEELVDAYELDTNKLASLVDNCTSTDDSFECNEATHPKLLPVAFGLFATMRLSAVVGDNDGLTLRGPLEQPPFTPNYWIDAFVAAPSYGLGSGCNNSTCEYYGGAHLTGNTKLCDVTIGNDVHGIFDWSIPGLALPLTIPITVDPNASPSALDAYVQDPQPLHLTVWSGRGVETYALRMDVDEIVHQQAICFQEKTKQQALCTKWVATQDWMLPPERWRPDFRINNLFEARIRVMDRYGRSLDYGYAHDFLLDVQTDRRGFVTSATILAEAHSTFGGRRVTSTGIAIPLQVPSNTFYTSDADVLDAAFAGRSAVQGPVLSISSRPVVEFDTTHAHLRQLLLGGR